MISGRSPFQIVLVAECNETSEKESQKNHSDFNCQCKINLLKIGDKVLALYGDGSRWISTIPTFFLVLQYKAM